MKGWQRLILGLGALAIATCGQSPPTVSMTRDRCHAQPGFTFIPGGEFLSGSDPTERDYAYRISAAVSASTPEAITEAEQTLRDLGWFDREPTRTTETLDTFCLGTNLVTQAEYSEFVMATGHRAPDISAAEYQAQGFLVHPYAAVTPYRWQNGQYPQDRALHPVVLVSYEDALAYATWRGQRDNLRYRLPTALEWEKAARGTDGRYFPWGSDWQANGTNWAGTGIAGTSAIAAFPLSRSSYGVEDMAGNVFEYTATLQDRQGQQVSIMKGCSWDDSPGFCRAAYRHTRPIASRHILFGFRLVLE
jgi:formylglycine-generating enzyme required for sulfatase activity